MAADGKSVRIRFFSGSIICISPTVRDTVLRQVAIFGFGSAKSGLTFSKTKKKGTT